MPNVDLRSSLIQGVAQLPEQGEVHFLVLVRFREVADYAEWPELDPPEPIAGRAAYEMYEAFALNQVRQVGGSVAFIGDAWAGPDTPDAEQWDRVYVAGYEDRFAFLRLFTPEHLDMSRHLSAGAADIRSIPITDTTFAPLPRD